MAGMQAAAAPIPIANFSRSLFYDFAQGVFPDESNPQYSNLPSDLNADGKLTAIEANFAQLGQLAIGATGILGLTGTKSVTVDSLSKFIGRKFDTQNAKGRPGKDGKLNQAEQNAFYMAHQRMAEHKITALSTPVAQLAPALLGNFDANRDGKINGQDVAMLQPDGQAILRALLGVAGTNSITADGMKTLLTRYDKFNAAKNRDGADGKLGQIEFNTLVADIMARMPQQPAPGADASTGAGVLPRRR